MSIKTSRLKEIINEEVQLFLEQRSALNEQGFLDKLKKGAQKFTRGVKDTFGSKGLYKTYRQLEKKKKPIWDKYTELVKSKGQDDPETQKYYKQALPIIKQIRQVRAALNKVGWPKKRKGGKRKRRGWRRTYRKGVMPKGVGFKSFGAFYAALDKAGIKVKKDKHWGRKHWSAWKKLKAAKKVPGGVNVTDKQLKRSKEITSIDPKTGRAKGATVGKMAQKIGSADDVEKVHSKKMGVKKAQANIDKRTKAARDENMARYLAIEKKAMANLKMAEKAAEAIPQTNAAAKLKAVEKVEKRKKTLAMVRSRMEQLDKTGTVSL